MRRRRDSPTSTYDSVWNTESTRSGTPCSTRQSLRTDSVGDLGPRRMWARNGTSGTTATTVRPEMSLPASDQPSTLADAGRHQPTSGERSNASGTLKARKHRRTVA